MSKTKDALKILDRITGKSAEVRKNIANARINFEVAQMIYDARTKAGLSQRELAERVGSRQSVIARLEDAYYRGHSLSMLQRIGIALGQQLELRFVAANRRGPRRAGESARQKRVLRRAGCR
jgi:ribosome-binding protein aMBF1 (putative translation factor)